MKRKAVCNFPFLVFASLSLNLFTSLLAVAATPDSPTGLAAICTSQDRHTVLEIFTESVLPTRISLVVNTALFQGAVSYLVQDLTGKYNEKDKSTTFTYEVDGNEIDVTLPDSISEEATISSPSEQISYKLLCKQSLNEI
jgi:hypothetical protein